ncbi:CDP-alcohol phosphatidyltransferase family protein [Homoserinimonas sp. A520]
MATEGSTNADSPGYRSTVAQLAIAQKPGRGAPPYSRWVNRRFGRWLAAGAYLLGRTPNQVTAASATMTFVALALVAAVNPSWWLGVLVTFLLLLGYALDSADGQLARLRGGGTKSGEWLDHIVDAFKNVLFHGVILVSFYRFGTGGPDAVLLIPLGFIVVSSVFFFGMMLTDQLRRLASSERGETYAKPSGGGGWLQTIVAIPNDYAVLCLAFLTFGWRTGFVIIYGLLFAANAVILFGVLIRWWRQLRTLDIAGSH